MATTLGQKTTKKKICLYLWKKTCMKKDLANLKEFSEECPQKVFEIIKKLLS
jgi:hypothetical protein